jgi:MATE family multidrug resistance protein
MVLNLGGLGLNVLLNAIMIYGWWGFPALGANGAAWATLITRILMAVAALWYVRYSKLMKQYLPVKMPDFKAIWKETFDIWKIGTPIALQTFAEWACFAISGIMIGWYGSVQLAAHAVALNAASLTYMVASGLSMAGSIRVGNAYGEQSLSSIRRIANMTFFMVVVFEIFNALIFIVFNRQIAGLYGVESDVMPYILPLFFLAAFFQISDGLQAAAMSVLRGIKDVVWASIISIIAYWVVSLPLSYLFGEILQKGVYGVWLGFTAGLFLAAILGVYRFYYQWKRIKF